MRKTTLDARFNLKEPGSTGPTLIYLFVNGGGGALRLKYSTGLKVAPASWDAHTQRVKTNQRTLTEKQTAKDLNSQLERFADAVGRLVSQLGLSGQTVTAEVLKEHLDRDADLHPFGKRQVEAVKVRTLTEYARRFIEETEKGKRLTPDAKRYTVGTLQTYRATLTHLGTFERSARYPLRFEAVNEKFYRHFTAYLTGTGKGLNTIGKTVKILKTWMRAALLEGLHENGDFGDFKKPAEETSAAYLSADELTALFRLDLSQNPRLDRIRDLFLVGCFTGLRFGDWHKVSADTVKCLNGREILRVATAKTGERVSVPVRSELAAILSKYGGTLPPVPSNQKINDYLKELGRVADLTDPQTVSETRGGKRLVRTVPKWELISTHTARRTFATNLILAGVPSQQVMKLTGHKKESTFQKYIRMTGDDVALQLAEHEYFRTPVLRVAV